MTEQRFIYGYGSTKHIAAHGDEWAKYGRDGVGLCGAWGGYPTEEPNRPTCKRCEKKAAKT